jgi:hypothetical protein
MFYQAKLTPIVGHRGAVGSYLSYSLLELACAACASISSRCRSHRARDTCGSRLTRQ